MMANKKAKTFMDSWTFDDILKVLLFDSNSKSTYKLLVAIRKEVEWPQHKDNIIKIQRSGCLKKIVSCLHSSHLQVVAVALSIIGNSCMEKMSACEIIYSNNGLSDLNSLLKRYATDDGINGRVFRIIGNMCQHSMSDIILDMKPQLLTNTVQVLLKFAEDEGDSIFSEATIVMAVRVLRQLLNGRTFFPLVKKFGVLKAIGTLLIRCTDEWRAKKKFTHVLDNIIKFLLQYSKYRYYPGITEMRNTPKGDAIIKLSYLLPFAPKKIVRIIMNFIRISQLKSDLPIPEICTGFVTLLRESSPDEGLKGEYREYIRCLCFLMDHPANRSIDRCKETMPQLIRVLNDFNNPHQNILSSCILIVSTLHKCTYHEPLIKEQLENNIVQVLVKKIEWIIGNSKTLIGKHKPQTQRKRKYSNDHLISKKFDMKFSELKEPKLIISSDEEMDYHLMHTVNWMLNRSSSPSSSSESEMVTSPWSSPGSSLHNHRREEYAMVSSYPDLSDSEDYSPVCSDVDEDEDISTFLNDEEQNNKEIERLSDGEDNHSEENIRLSAFSLKLQLLTDILMLLKFYSTMQPSPTELCSEGLLFVLLRCASMFDHNSITTDAAITVICRILQTHDYLIPLMQTEIISAVHSLTKTPHGAMCNKCHQVEQIGYKILSRFSMLAESGKGKGDIANKLIVGSSDTKKLLVLTIPYIVKSRPILNSLMVNCGGLDVLMKLLPDLRFQEKSIKTLCVLAVNNLRICNPQQWTGSQREKMVIDNYRVSESCKNVVTFVLDDNSCLSADRDFLCEKSCFFNSLLNGSFRESNEDYVKLHHTDYRALKSLIQLLHCDFEKTEPKDIQLETRTLLEVIMLCDRYLLEDLCVFLTECVQQLVMSASNVPVIYKWSLESKTNILRVESIAYALAGEIEDAERISMFTNLFKLDCLEEIVKDIRNLLERYLTLRGLY